jgi:hypothetical protein
MDTSHYITRFHIVRLIIWQGSNDAIHPQDERRILKVAAFVAIRSSNLSQSEQCPYPAKTYEQDLNALTDRFALNNFYWVGHDTILDRLIFRER